MTGKAAAVGVSVATGPYFYLSYAHTDPLAGDPEVNPDELVAEFFGDLSEAVREHATRLSGLKPGFYDREIPVGSDWKKSIRQVLSRVQAFVPLYSAAYMTREWSGQEWECFYQRLRDAGVDDPGRRLVRIYWAPLPVAQNQPELQEALALGAAVPGYAENGLRALLKIGPYRSSYEEVVNRAAGKIIMLAEASPLAPSVAPDLDHLASPFLPKPHFSVFSIEMAAPTQSTVVAERDPRGYGESSTDWRPFPEQELPLSEYARQVAKRLGFKPEVSGIKKVSSPHTRRPGIILIDPWFIADDHGRLALESAMEHLPRWVLPVLVLGQPDDATTQKLADQVREILNAAGALPTDSPRRAPRAVSTLDDFVAMLGVLVAEAGRQYLRRSSGRHGSGQLSSTPSGGRPRLRLPPPGGSASTPDRNDSAPNPVGETPDA